MNLFHNLKKDRISFKVRKIIFKEKRKILINIIYAGIKSKTSINFITRYNLVTYKNFMNVAVVKRSFRKYGT